MPKLSNRSRTTLNGVHPDLVRLVEAAIIDTPVDFTVVQGVRTDKYQNDLYHQGRTKPGAIVTNIDGYNKKSNHQKKADGYGHAFDILPYYNGSVQTGNEFNKAQLAELVEKQKSIAVHIKAIAKCLGIKIVWGGDWKSIIDRPHFELK